MKKHLIYTATLASSALLFSACFEKKEQEPTKPAEIQESAKPEPPAQPTDAEISQLIQEQLPAGERATAGTLTCDAPGKNDDGSLSITAHLSMVVKENLYTRETAPEAFNKERQLVNEAANNAMKPESVYLMQIGADTSLITDADRAAKALPADLQAALNELKELADASVYSKTIEAGKEVSVSISFHATYKENTWVYDNIVLDNANLLALDALTPESALNPDIDNVLTPEFEAARKQLIREKSEAFNNNAKPYILSREEAARATLTQKLAQIEEEARREKEALDKAEAEKAQWINACSTALSDGNEFAGEWVRGDRFGELTLQIQQAKVLDDNSIQFIGMIYDTKLPEASLDVEGRCDLTPTEEGAKINISIYDGQYDPDQPTAEVYDAKDGQLVLVLDRDGKMSGVMTCAVWGTESDKAFRIKLSPKKKK